MNQHEEEQMTARLLDARQRRVRQHHNHAFMADRQPTQQADELPDLTAIIPIAGEQIGQRVEDQKGGFQIAAQIRLFRRQREGH